MLSSRRFPAFQGIPLALALASFMALGSGCSLKSKNNKVLRVGFPSKETAARLSAGKTTAKTSGKHSSRSPASIDDFTCYGVLVTGPGIAADSRVGCAKENGIWGGLISADQGGDLELSVPSGAKRNVQVFALKSTVSCPSLSKVLSAPAETRWKGIESFYVIGSAVTDVVDDVSVPVKVSYDPETAVPFMEGCLGEIPKPNDPKFEVASGRWINSQTEAAPANCRSVSGRPCLQAVTTIGAVFRAPSQSVSASSPVARHRFEFKISR